MDTLFQIDISAIAMGGSLVAAAGLISVLIEMAKKLPKPFGNWVDAEHEPLIAMVLAAGLVVWSIAAAATVITPASLFIAFLAWVGIIQLTQSAHDKLLA